MLSVMPIKTASSKNGGSDENHHRIDITNLIASVCVFCGGNESMTFARYTSSIFLRTYRERIAPITKEGIEVKEILSKGVDGHVSATEFSSRKEQRPNVFTPSTVVLNDGHGLWELALAADIRSDLVDATLRIETIRTHGMLHTPTRGKYASVYVNDQLLDKIHLVKPHPHGEDFGVNSRRPYPIFKFMDRKRDIQTVRIDVDEGVYWDIDRVSIEPIVERRDLTPLIWMIIGALVSALIGVLVGPL